VVGGIIVGTTTGELIGATAETVVTNGYIAEPVELVTAIVAPEEVVTTEVATVVAGCTACQWLGNHVISQSLGR
jgi:hypothetical protein